MSAWQLVLAVGVVLVPLSWACLWIALRLDPRVAAMPDDEALTVLPVWPLSDGDDGSAEPYLRVGSRAASLTGRR